MDSVQRCRFLIRSKVFIRSLLASCLFAFYLRRSVSLVRKKRQLKSTKRAHAPGSPPPVRAVLSKKLRSALSNRKQPNNPVLRLNNTVFPIVQMNS